MGAADTGLMNNRHDASLQRAEVTQKMRDGRHACCVFMIASPTRPKMAVWKEVALDQELFCTDVQFRTLSTVVLDGAYDNDGFQRGVRQVDNLLCMSNKYGVIFLGTPQGQQKTRELLSRCRAALQPKVFDHVPLQWHGPPAPVNCRWLVWLLIVWVRHMLCGDPSCIWTHQTSSARGCQSECFCRA